MDRWASLMVASELEAYHSQHRAYEMVEGSPVTLACLFSANGEFIGIHKQHLGLELSPFRLLSFHPPPTVSSMRRIVVVYRDECTRKYEKST